MVSLDKAIIARYSKFGKHFEVWVDPKVAREFRNNPDINIFDVVVAREIFSDARKGKRATEDDLMKAFDTTDFEKVLLKILKSGDIPLTTEQRHEMADKKMKQIIEMIARGAVDPRTKMPHTRERIERMMKEHKIHIDLTKTAQEQVKTVLEKLKEFLPISMEQAKVWVKLTAQDASRMYGILKENGISNEKWNSDGSLEGECRMPAGLTGEFFDKINKSASGHVDSKILE